MRIRQPHLLFDTEVDGCSLSTYFHTCEHEAPTLLLVQTTSGHAFGAYLSDPWSRRRRKGGHHQYFGTGECFIFLIQPSYHAFHWVNTGHVEGAPTMFMTASPDRLAIGGGGSGHGLELESYMLTGSTHECSTFEVRCERLGMGGGARTGRDDDGSYPGHTFDSSWAHRTTRSPVTYPALSRCLPECPLDAHSGQVHGHPRRSVGLSERVTAPTVASDAKRVFYLVYCYCKNVRNPVLSFGGRAVVSLFGLLAARNRACDVVGSCSEGPFCFLWVGVGMRSVYRSCTVNARSGRP